jgi:Anp1.
MTALPKILILTPVKDAVEHTETYFRLLSRLSYPHDRISLGVLEGDSADDTFDCFRRRLGALEGVFRRVGLWKKDFGFRIPAGTHRWAPPFQIPRRAVLAKARNHLLFRALDDEDWVLWLDVDVDSYPADVIEQLLAYGKDVLIPHCVKEFGKSTFDYNAWRDKGRLHMQDLRAEGEMVRLDAVGGTMLLVRADLHRDGLIFPAFPYGVANPRVRDPALGELETEGLGLMAADLGVQCWGLPGLEIRHHMPGRRERDDA